MTKTGINKICKECHRIKHKSEFPNGKSLICNKCYRKNEQNKKRKEN